MQIFRFLNIEKSLRLPAYAQHMSKRGTGTIVPLECDSEVRSEIASFWIRPFADAGNRGGYLKIHREFYREAVDTRANERSYFHSAISLFLSLSFPPSLPFSLSFSLSLFIIFCSLGVVQPKILSMLLSHLSSLMKRMLNYAKIR